eukprot:TRINITY_DN32418_c0_g1_i1.p1 TRINITY_DN32418_c0_g1~~TRINITY_DN32418_c0_g1_i1.p1  ORF type:complete len:2262 (+),score=447.00 TRINITY_DN32418_c0_g1_i1:103-6888(+)
MRLSEILRPASFRLVAGQSTSIQKLDSLIDEISRDWDVEEPALPSDDGDTQHGLGGPSLSTNSKAQIAIVRLWDLFQKTDEGAIERPEYEAFVRRVIRVVLPALDEKYERMLASNTWEGDVGTLDKMSFPLFFRALARFAKMWTDAGDATVAAEFLEDICNRITRLRIVQPGGNLHDLEQTITVTFRADDGSDVHIPDCDFGIVVAVGIKGNLPSFQVDASFDRLQKSTQLGMHLCFFSETVLDPRDNFGHSDAVARVWAPLDEIVPMGHAALVALIHAEKDCRLNGRFDVHVDSINPPPEHPPKTTNEAVYYAVGQYDGTGKRIDQISCEVTRKSSHASTIQEVSVNGTSRSFVFHDLLGVGMLKDSPASTMLVRPELGSMLYKLAKLRRDLQTSTMSAADAALPGFSEAGGLRGRDRGHKLSSFMDALENNVALDPATNLMKEVKDESLFLYGSLSSLAETFIAFSAVQDGGLAGKAGADDTQAMDDLRNVRKRVIPRKDDIIFGHPEFPPQEEGLRNDMKDILNLARRPPVTLWVFGECDEAGAYKTEVCRRLANELGLQWLKPAYVLELAVKTPLVRRSPLMAYCVELLERGMEVSTINALRLTHELMNSARCKTNGYVLELPPLSPADVEAMTAFTSRVRDFSVPLEIRLSDAFRHENEPLPPLKPDPEPPKPPADAVADEEGGEGEVAEGAEAESGPGEAVGSTADDAEAGEATGVGGAEDAGEGEAAAEADAAVGHDEVEDAEPVLEEPFVPNGWVDLMPRRLILLTTESDELAAWRLAQLERQHEEKRLKALEATDDELQEDDDDGDGEVEELPTLPEDEEELREVFEDRGGDVLLAMEKYIRLDALDPSKKLPPLPDTSKELIQEEEDKLEFKAGEAAAVKVLHERYRIPFLSLHVDARTPQEVARLLDVTTGKFEGSQVVLPVVLEGGGGEPMELLRAGLLDQQASRRWSLWRQYCPVSLHSKQLLAGDKEFAVEFMGRVFLFADLEKQRRFRAWPKLYLKDPPRINAPGMRLGFVLLSPCGFRCRELACRLRDTYGFDVIDVVALVEAAMRKPALEKDLETDPPEDMAEVAASAIRLSESEENEGCMRLFEAEQEALLNGRALGLDTLTRLIAGALGIAKNASIVRTRDDELAKQIKELEDSAEGEGGPPPHIVLDDEGKPVVDYQEPFVVPKRGFVIIGFPESEEQLQAVQAKVKLEIERVIILKQGDEAATERDLLVGEGFDLELPLESVLETTNANFESFAGDSPPPLVEVPLEKTESEQFIAIQKLIDPFYIVVEQPEHMAMEIPDPDEWEPADVDENEEPPQKPVIPWGVCGMYCPVTLKHDFWLVPGQKEFQHVVGNSVYSLSSEKASEAFVAEPIMYIPDREPTLPPPRILITGPTGSGVARQCEMLATVYRVSVLKFEELWTASFEKRIEKLKEAAKKARELEELKDLPMMDEEMPKFPEGWRPSEPKLDDEADVEAEEEQEEVDIGLSEDEVKEQIFVDVTREILGAHCGACVIDGTFFKDLEDEAPDPARSLASLLSKAQRVPDLVVILNVKNDAAFGAVHDPVEIDRLFKLEVDAYEELKKRAEENEEDIPEPPEHLAGKLDDDGDEKESDRVRASFVEKKKLEQAALTEFAEALSGRRVPVQRVLANRSAEATHKGIRWHCRRFMDERASLLLRDQVVNVTPPRQGDKLVRSLSLPSRFGDASPMFVDVPWFSGRHDARQFGVDLRSRLYHPRSETEKVQFMERPQDFIHLPSPSRVACHPAVVVSGPPLVGKTELSKFLAQRTGAVYLCVADIIGHLCGPDALPCSLSREISECLRQGAKVADVAIIKAVRHRLAAPDVLTRGWIMDDFPLTERQAMLLTQVGIIPHCLLFMNLPEQLIFARVKKSGSDLVQQESALQRKRIDAYAATSPILRAYYGLNFENLVDIDGTKSSWAICDRALKETSAAISRRLEYYRRTSEGKAARIHGMSFPHQRLFTGQSPWRHYCVVMLSLYNELVVANDPQCIVEYKSRIYWLSSFENVELFMEDPESFLQVPLPPSTPHLLAVCERRSVPMCQLEDYCPVALVDHKKLEKASGQHVIQYQGKYWNLDGKEACAKFLRRPMRYVSRAKLPSKKPPLPGQQSVALLKSLSGCRDGKSLEPAEMLTYMQASVAEVICQALVDSGERRPVFPGKTPHESALIFLARFLRARNSLNTDLSAERVREEFESFVNDCALPQHLGEIIERRRAQREWTPWDDRRYAELASRFDQIFSLSLSH